MKLTAHMIKTRVIKRTSDILDQLIELGEAAINDSGTVVKATVCRDVVTAHFMMLLIDIGVFVPGDVEPVGLNPESEQCPECGYTLNDCQTQGDHHICGRYPFFKEEKGIL